MKTNNKDIIIRKFKDIITVFGIAIFGLAIIIFLCQPEKMTDLLLSKEIIGLLGAAIGGSFAFIIGNFVGRYRSANEISELKAEIKEKDALIATQKEQLNIACSVIKKVFSPRKKQPKAQSDATQESDGSSNSVKSQNTVENRAKNIFDVLDQLSEDVPFRASPKPDEDSEKESTNLQENPSAE